jgi:septum formation protein
VETDWVLGADTCVVSSGDLLGKPADRQQAQEMLRQLSGRRHQVFTGVCLLRGERLLRQTGCTEVEFSTLTQAQQQAYLDTGEWQGKAGGYAIQGFASAFVCRLVGSYTNVVGLPLFETAQLLQQAGICVWQAAQGQHEGRQKKTDRNKP